MSNAMLAIINQAKIRLHCLRNTFPCGIRSIDDDRDEKIKWLEKYLKEMQK